MANHLYYGDNLEVLRESIRDESIDLVYLDPPFNSNATYNVLFRGPSGDQSQAQIEAFEDTWHWNNAAEKAFDEVMSGRNGDVADMLRAMPASHYLKVLMDVVFGWDNYRNEIVWKRTTTHSDSKTWSKVSDIVLFFSKTRSFTWNSPKEPHSAEYIADKYNNDDGDGRGPYQLDNMTSPNPRPNMMYDWRGFPYPAKGWRYERETMARLDAEKRIWYPTHDDGSLDVSRRPRLKRYLSEMEGGAMGTVWSDISPINSQAQERLGYPTQKPVALLERILSASSNPGDVVLDPFCGCGTTVHAAEKLGRQWIGIDITHLSISLIEKRLKDAFPGIKFEVHGAPKDLDGARDLSNRDKFQFQWWAVSLVDAVPFGGKKKGADGGIDGHIYFRTGPKTTEKAIVSVKGGGVGVKDIRELIAVVDRERAKIGVYISLEPHTEPMKKEAAGAGLYDTGMGKKVPKIQLFTIEELFAGKQPDIPLIERGFKTAAREERDSQEEFDL